MSKYIQRNNLLTQASFLQNQNHIRLGNNNRISNSRRSNNQKMPSQSIEDIVQTLNLYLRSANNLKKNLSIGVFSAQPQNNRDKVQLTKYDHTHQNINSTQFKTILTKIQFFIQICSIQLQKINKAIQLSSNSQLQSLGGNYVKILVYIKQRYSHLIKQAFRTLNMQNRDIKLNLLNQQDKEFVKQNRKKKLENVNQIQKEMNMIWENHNHHDKMFNRSFLNDKNQHKYQNSPSKEQKNYSSLIVELEDEKSKKTRKVQFLEGNVQDLDLRKLAKQQLQKQFLALRLQAYNMYQSYINHSHQQFDQSLEFTRQQQQILQSQMEQYRKINLQLKQQYNRLKRQLSQVKTINQLIKKRYVLRESIRMDSQEAIYY